MRGIPSIIDWITSTDSADFVAAAGIPQTLHLFLMPTIREFFASPHHLCQHNIKSTLNNNSECFVLAIHIRNCMNQSLFFIYLFISHTTGGLRLPAGATNRAYREITFCATSERRYTPFHATPQTRGGMRRRLAEIMNFVENSRKKRFVFMTQTRTLVVEGIPG